MKALEAINCIDDVLNSDYHYDESLGYQLTSDDFEWLEKSKEALKKQIPQKPYKVKKHKQNDYYCTVCKRYLGDEMELKYACLQPEYCQHCGQSLDWLDHPTEKGGEQK